MKSMCVTVTFCCVQFWITRTINTCDFEGTRELAAREYQVAFELYRKWYMYQQPNNMYLFFQVAHSKISNSTDLKDEILTELHLLLPDVEFNTISQDAMTTIHMELATKLCNIRIQEFLSAIKQDLAAKKGLASTVDVNLRTTLLTHHTKVSTIRLQ